MAEVVKWPFGAATTALLTATGAQAVTIVNALTIVDGVSTQATGNRTLNLTIGAEITTGAMVVVKCKTAAVETLTFGTGCTAPVSTGVAGKTKVISLVYDGTTFKQMGAEVQLD